MSNQHVQDNISDWGHSGPTASANEARLTAILDQVPGAVGLFSTEGRSLLRRGPLSHLWSAMIPSRDPILGRRWRSFDEAGRLLPTSDYPGERALKGEIGSTRPMTAAKPCTASAQRPSATKRARSLAR